MKLVCKFCGGPADDLCEPCARSFKRELTKINVKLQGKGYDRFNGLVDIAVWAAKRARAGALRQAAK